MSTPPSIFIDARNLTAQPSGIGNYARNLIPRLVALSGSEKRWVVIRHQSNLEPLAPIDHDRYVEISSGREIGKWHDFLLGAGELHGAFRTWGPARIYHNLFHISPLPWSDFGSYTPRVVLTLHDLIWLDAPLASQPTLARAAWVKLYGELAIRQSLKRADRVICVSQATADRAASLITPERRVVIPHGVDQAYFEPQPTLHGALAMELWGKPYAVAVGNDKPYKNLATLIRAFGRAQRRGMDGKLVLVGRCERLAPLVCELGLEGQVIFAGVLDDAPLRALIADASLFVFPSLLEGFGLPPLEAMALGAPTAVSDLEPMRSVAGEGAMRFAPHDVEELARLITRLFTRQALREQWSERGRARAQELTWERCAQRTLAVYNALL